MSTIFESAPKKKIWPNIFTLLVFGLAVYLIIPEITSIGNSWQVLLNLYIWAVIIAFFAQVLSYLGSGYLLKKTLEITNQTVSLIRSTFIVLGSASIALVAGGTVGGSAAIFRWTSGKKGSVEGATLASLLPSLFNSLMLVLFSIFGLAHLILVHDLTQIQLIGFSITIVFLGFVIGIATLASRYRNHVSSAIIRVLKFFTHLQRKPFDSTSAVKEVDNIFTSWNELWRGKWHLLALGSFLNVIFDMVTLYLLFIAAGNTITFGMLLSGYALPLLLGRIAFILPGGVGVVETSMVALYTGLGIPNATAVVVVGGYRLISFWIPSLVGFPIATSLQRARNKSDEKLEAHGPVI